MKKINKILYFSLLIALASCTERIEIELDEGDRQLVVYGEVTTDTCVQTVKLSTTTAYYYDQAAPTVSDAIVEISDGETTVLLTEDPSEKGVYKTKADFYGEVGKTYYLNITNVDINGDGVEETYSANSYLPKVGPLDSIGLKYTENSFFSGWEVMVYAYDLAQQRDFYSFKVLKNGELITDSLQNLQVQNDDFFNGNYTFGITSQFLNDDSEEEKAVPGDSVVFEINGITEEFYVYVLEAQSEIFPGTPLFSGPPSNISTNISNGGLGFFTAYSIKRSGKTVPVYPDGM